MSLNRTDLKPPTDAGVLRNLLNERASCRAFTSEVVPAPVIRDILEMSQRTASWCNSQSWHLAVTSGGGTDRLRSALHSAASSGVTESTDIEFPREYRGVHKDRRRESGYQLYNALGIERGDRARQSAQSMQNFKFFGAPHVAIVHTDEALGPYGAVDCGAYVSNFILSAAAWGVSTVAQAAVAMYPGVLRAELGLDSDRTIVCGIAFGFPDIGHAANGYRTNRAEIDDVVDWIDK